MSDYATMPNNDACPRAVFAHGLESGPWGRKIKRLAGVAERHGFVVDSPDYTDLADARARRRRLQALAPTGWPLVLVGSSMGGYVAAMACAALQPDALLLMAPALYRPDDPGDPAGCPADTVVVHGWRDAIVAPAASIDFARRRRAGLHLLDDDHRLAASLDFIAVVFARLLARARRDRT